MCLDVVGAGGYPSCEEAICWGAADQAREMEEKGKECTYHSCCCDQVVVTLGWCFLHLLSANPFEAILKSFLRYQPSLNGDTGESHLRRKLYENGVTKSLQSNLALIQKVTCFSAAEKPYVAHRGKFNENDY